MGRSRRLGATSAGVRFDRAQGVWRVADHRDGRPQLRSSLTTSGSAGTAGTAGTAAG